ncbi:MAG: ribonuclease H-like domain-containing protein [Chloroflexi bacterium]|nr:ribonuclease H-like domain-containing protein [Chloroflexota bacterium]
MEAYLDIETTGLSAGDDSITVIGVHLTGGGRHDIFQLVGRNVTRENLLDILDGVDVIYTYNGGRFDLPFIARQLGVDLSHAFVHRDLMLDCWKQNLYGGFKAVEAQLGIARELKGICGLDAVRLWWRYLNNDDDDALALLLKYNEEDVVNLRTLKERLGIDQR